MKKFFIIITIILAVALVLSLGFMFVIRNRDAAPASDNASLQAGAKKVLATEVISAVPSFNGERIWYFTLEGKMLSINPESETREEFILPEAINNPTGVLWQEKGSDFIATQNIGGHIRFSYVKASDKQISAYPENIRTPVILVGDTRIAYDWVTKTATSTSHELKISDIDGNNFTKIGDLFRADYMLSASPRKQELIMFTAATSSPLVLVDLGASVFSNIADNGVFESVRFSPDGSKLLVNENKLGAQVFWVYDFVTKEKKDLGLASPDFAIWSRDSRGVIFETEDTLKEIDLQTETLKDWGSFTGDLIRDAFLHPFKDILFYIDGPGNLYSLNLATQ